MVFDRKCPEWRGVRIRLVPKTRCPFEEVFILVKARNVPTRLQHWVARELGWKPVS